MKRFDALAVPLQGVSLIEAAAGTGKTHAVEELFLRLVVEAEIPVEEIVVVTFTRAATAELRDRIYRRAAGWAARLAGAEPRGGDPLLDRLLDRHGGDPSRTAWLMRRALIDFDRAVILTIHGFCQRLLFEHAFETASGFRFEIATDPAPLLEEIVQDFWREAICNQPPEFLEKLRPSFSTPEGWLSFLQLCQAPEFVLYPQRTAPALRPESLEAFRSARGRLRALWPGAEPAVRRLLMHAPLHARHYGREGTAGPGSRAERIEGLLAAVGTFLEDPPPGGPPPQAVEKLGASALQAATRKGGKVPRHVFFDACEETAASWAKLEAEMAAELIYLKSRFLSFVNREAAQRKARRGILTFDDLLRRTADALAGPGAKEFAALARQRYRAALVDEFQDTDALQYRILQGIFGLPPQLLLLIGDPKQSIYGFRGADLYSYLRAARKVSHAFTLEDNHRSREPLVKAVNTLFQRAPAPFVLPEIAFRPARAACGGAGEGPGLVIWYLDSRQAREDGKPLDALTARNIAGRAVRTEILRLTASPDSRFTPGDIAVLVRSNAQARFMKQLLAERQIPAVVYGTADVFASDEALELHFLLSAIARPADAERLKTALAARFFGLRAAAISALEREPSAWQARQERHGEYLNLWRTRGFAVMMRHVIRGEAFKERLLRLPDGERRITNLLHLVELVNQAVEEERLGIEETLAWLARRLDPAAQGAAPEQQLRLESDDRAVQIITQHRSKGLAYPVVFLPFAGTASQVDGKDFLFHDPCGDDRPTLDVSGEKESPRRIQALKEDLAENLRLFYVALTRARERCYLAWGRTRSAQSSALAWLLRSADPEGEAGADPVGSLLREYRKLDDEALIQRLSRLVADAEGAIALEPPPAEEALPPATKPAPPPCSLSRRAFSGRIDDTWGVTSYSALIAGRFEEEDPLGEVESFAAASATPSAAERPQVPLASFPSGAKSGIFFHELLERADFQGDGFRENALTTLALHGIDPAWADPVEELLSQLAGLPLFHDPQPVCLRGIDPPRRVPEMEFTLPLKRVTPGLIRELFHDAALPPAAQAEQQIGRLHFSPVRGFLRGVIDLVFEHRGRFYLVDWKSNLLGGHFDDYRPEALARAMAGHLYLLQAYLYVLALHRLLAVRVPGYRYEEHFGGVAYVFLRGVRGERDPAAGVFRDRPDPQLIRRWEEALLEPAA
ncbi:MAG: UvrD-helicase domain-containing protein [Desulfobacterales bacterium]